MDLTGDAEVLLAQIEQACRTFGMAQTTFGRESVNDGKLVSRLQQGGRVTTQTVARVHRFIEQHGGATRGTLRSAIKGLDTAVRPEHNFRFYDNSQKYLMFVNTTSEKEKVADLAVQQLMKTQPAPPAIRLFEGGSGDGTALTRILRGLHRARPSVPLYVVAKEISMENIRLTLSKMPDRFQEHPATVLVATNLSYADAPRLHPGTAEADTRMVWHEVMLDGGSAGEFEEQIAGIETFLRRHWGAHVSSVSGGPVARTPVTLVIYRRDHRFVLDPIIPRRGHARADFDFVLLSQPYRARASIRFKTARVLTPLVRALRPNGRLLGIHSCGNDPGMDLLRKIWPEEDPFTVRRGALFDQIERELGVDADRFHFHRVPNGDALFRYEVRNLPSEIDESSDIGSSTLFAAWNAATYVGQIDDRRLAQAMTNDRYLEATAATLRQHRGLWFNDEMYVISRRPALD